MAELKTIYWKKNFGYTGLIAVKPVYRVVRDWLSENDFNPYEEEHTEQIFPDGKEILIKVKGKKDLSDYAQIKWETKITFLNLKDKVIEKDGQKVKMSDGSVKFSTKIFLATDYEGSYEQTGFLYFLRILIDRFVAKSYINKAVARVKHQYGDFQDKVKSYLNMESFR